MIITRAMPTQQTAITGVSRRITAGQEIKAELCRGPGFGDVGGAGQAVQVDGEVPQRGHHLWTVAGAYLAQVFPERHVSYPVQTHLDAPMAAEPGRQLVGAGLAYGQVGDGVHSFGAPFTAVPFADLAGHLDCLGGVREQDPVFYGEDFQGALLDPPVAAVVFGVGDGDLGPGQPGELFAQGGLIALDGEQVMRAALFDEVFRVVFWQCSASAVTSTPNSSMLSRSVENMGISFVFRATSSCPRTIPLMWVDAASRCRHRPPPVAEPRTDLPSTAITRSSFGFTSRSAAQAPRMKSRPLPSSLLMVRRKVDSLGTSPVTPNFANPAGVAAAAHSPIATNERAPAMTAHAAIARIPGSACRTPRGLRGSGTVFSAASNAAGAFGMSGNSSSSNWSTTVYVGDDDIGHGPS